MTPLLRIRQHIGHVLSVPWRSVRVTVEHRVKGWVLRVRCGNARMTLRYPRGPRAALSGRVCPLDGYLYGSSRTRREAIAWGARLVTSYSRGRFRVFDHSAGRRA